MPGEYEPFCFWCGGNARIDFTARPRSFHAEKQQLCANCEEIRGDGIMVFETTEKDPGCSNPVLAGNAGWYTGRWVVISDKEAAATFPTAILPSILNGRIAGLREDEYAKAGYAKYKWRTIQ